MTAKKTKETRVGKNTDPFKLGISIIMSLDEYDEVLVIAFGNEAINNMTRGLIAANMLSAQNNTKLNFNPQYAKVIDNFGVEKVAVAWGVTRGE